jgi:hypothetical protein
MYLPNPDLGPTGLEPAEFIDIPPVVEKDYPAPPPPAAGPSRHEAAPPPTCPADGAGGAAGLGREHADG